MGAEAMTIEVTRAHCLGGGNDVEIGTRLRAPGDLTIEEAEAKVRQDFAVVVPPVTASRPQKEKQGDPEKAPEPGAPEVADEATDKEVQTGDPAVETRDPGSPASPTSKPRTSRKAHKGA